MIREVKTVKEGNITEVRITDEIISGKVWRSSVKLVNQYRRPFLILYIYSLIIYMPLLVLRLTNDIDGLWNQDDYVAGSWELSIGRWFWPYLDKLRFKNSLDPMPGVLSLAVYVVAFLLILCVLRLPISKVSYLAGFMFLASTGITCQMSHGYMVITFSVSTFLSVLGVWILVRRERDKSKQHGKEAGKKMIVDILASAVVISLMMGCYQAGIGITCLTAMFVFLMTLTGYRGSDEEDGSKSEEKAGSDGLKTAFIFAAKMLIALLLGAVFYEILLHIHLKIFNMELSSYQGFSEIGPAYLISHLPDGIVHAYRFTKNYFIDGLFRFNVLQTKRLFPVVYIIPIAAGVIGAVKSFREYLWNGVFYVLGFLLIPVFAGSFYLLAAEAETHMQMTVPYSMIIPLFICQYNFITLKNLPRAGRNLCGGIFAMAALFLVWGDIGMTLTDQYAMYVGRKSSATLAQNILNSAVDLGEDFINGQFLIVGTPAMSPVFSVGDLYYEANSYAQYGNWSEDVSFGRISWTALYDNYLRVNVSFATGDTEATIAALPEVAAMPVYPASGSVQNVYGVTVIKVGNIE